MGVPSGLLSSGRLTTSGLATLTGETLESFSQQLAHRLLWVKGIRVGHDVFEPFA